MNVFFSVGEPSGDQHAAHLMEEIRRRRPDVQFSGFGGPMMEQAGCKLLFRLTNLAVMGFFQILPVLGKFIRLVGEAKRYFQEHRPDAVVLVDFPGFNWWIARKAKAAGIPVFYYLPPQMWAWAPWRIRKVRKYIDHVLCGLPFEPEWYAKRGVQVDYVGHPFFDEVAEHQLDEDFCRERIQPGTRNVSILPGSRNSEIAKNWPLMLDIMKRVAQLHENVRFLVANYRPAHRQRCEAMLADSGYDLPIEFIVDKTSEIIESSECCLMVSGSVSLEILARKKPAAVIYQLPRLHRLLKPIVLPGLKAISLPNLMAGRTVLPEWIVSWTPRRDVRQIAAKLDSWLYDPHQLSTATREVTELFEQVGTLGATKQVADAILNRLPAAPTQPVRKAA
jgi:lipid-A-disaccharide synthase